MKSVWLSHKKAILKRLLALVLLLAVSLYSFKLKEVHYTLDFSNLSQPREANFQQTHHTNSSFRLALITDLHGCYYGENQQDLISRLQQQHPQVILLGGDIYDDDMPFTHTDTLLAQLSTIAPTYYVDGNHEWWLPTQKRLETLNRIKGYGIDPIMGKQVAVANTRIHIFGVSDPESGQFEAELAKVGASANPENINILLSHRPERIEDYQKYPFDLVLSGHAHGGQWRIPLLMNGLVAPNQGLFPKYAGGLYEFATSINQHKTSAMRLIVSRGLARESTPVPRFFNRPELVFIDIQQ